MFAEELSASSPPIPGRSRLSETVWQTVRRFRAGETVEEIATRRMLAIGTTYGHLAEAILAGEAIDLNQFLTAEEQSEVAAAFKKAGFGNLTGVYELLGGRYEYGRLRLARAALAP